MLSILPSHSDKIKPKIYKDLIVPIKNTHFLWFKIIILEINPKTSQRIVGLLENYEEGKLKDMEIERHKKEMELLNRKSEQARNNYKIYES